MKYSEKMFFAQPVVRHGSDDFPSATLSVDVSDATVSEESVDFSVKVGLECASLETLTNNGKAVAAIFITCMNTRFSQLGQLSLDVEKKFTIPSAKLFGRVTILPVIYSAERIDGWKSDELHAEYSGKVDIGPATLLAVAEESAFSVDRKRLKPLESIFELAVDDSLEKGATKVDADGQKITLRVHSDTKENLDGIRNSQAGRAILLNSVYLPALMEVFSQIQQDDSSFESHSWFRVFRAKCDAHDINPSKCSILDASQTLLGIPFLELQSVAAKLL